MSDDRADATEMGGGERPKRQKERQRPERKGGGARESHEIQATEAKGTDRNKGAQKESEREATPRETARNRLKRDSMGVREKQHRGKHRE